MTTLTKSNDGLLRMALRGNMLFSAITGALGAVMSRAIGDVIGGIPSVLIMGTGIFLIGYAALLLWASSQPEIPQAVAWLAVVGDAAWVIGSIILLLAAGSILTTAGKWMIAIIADIVAAFAIAQYVGIRRINRAA